MGIPQDSVSMVGRIKDGMMGRIIDLAKAQALPHGQLKSWAYNALDVTGTREVADVLLPRLNERQQKTYAFERALQAPSISMMRKGVRVDVEKRKMAVRELEKELKADLKAIAKLPEVAQVWDGMELETGFCSAEPGKRHKWPRGVEDGPGKVCERCGTSRLKLSAFNPNSPQQVDHLFYDLHKIPPMMNKKKQQSTDGDVLERIGKKHTKLKPVTDAILAVRDKKKQLGTLNAKLSPDNRFYSSFNVGAAWTGRFSSSKNPYGLGGNLQNVPERHRYVFIPDVGYDIAYIDLMQAESNVVAHIAGDQKYIDAHNSGDVHTFATRLIWTDLPWTGDLKKDKVIAKQNPPWDQAPGHDYRFQAKRIQHGSNYGLSPYGISMIAQIPVKEAKLAYDSYFTAFPGIKAWQEATALRIRAHEPLVNIFGREITLFGRPWDEHTYKQGLAFIPQSSVADLLDLAMYLSWDKHDPWDFQLLAQVHDATLCQYKEGQLDILKNIITLMELPIPVNGRTMTIKVEAAYGKNWGKKNDKNPNGLVEL